MERLCDRLLIIDHGRVIEDGTVDGVKKRYGTERVLVVDLEAPGPPVQIAGVEVTRVDGPRHWLRFHRDHHTAASLLAQITAQARVRDISIEEPAIDDVVRHIYSTAQA